MVESYYRYFAWHFDVAPREELQPIFDQVYATSRIGVPHQTSRTRYDPQQLALLFIILAMGSRHTLEHDTDDNVGADYLALSKACLAKGDFMSHNTIAGVQALHIMAHYYLETDESRSGDSAWPLWGLSMRLIEAMGLHRDGERWKLPSHEVERRRRVFWECHTADIFQANCFSRPNSIYPEYLDTEMPAERHELHNVSKNEKGYHTLKFELAQLSAQILDIAMRPQTPDYSRVSALHEDFSNLQRSIPYSLRCRAMLQAMPSMYPDSADACQESPEPSKEHLTNAFQQHFLAMNISEMVLYLHRPFFARMIHEQPHDPTQSPYGLSYLAVVERCNVIIQVVTSINKLYPAVSARHWVLWYQSFNSAVCMGALALHHPSDPLAGFAISQLDATIELYLKVVQTYSSAKKVQNLRWLMQLRLRATQAMDRISRDVSQVETSPDELDVVDVELLGWRTRLVERAGGHTLATTISPSSSGLRVTPSPNTAVNQTISRAVQQLFTDDLPVDDHLDGASMNVESTADFLLSQICEPMFAPSVPDLAGNEFVNAMSGTAPGFTQSTDWDDYDFFQ
ncbi:fungal-specific transcription factor domain-domain-containing protein [Naematelia encephala]|uniref:Fungal-specific transcription factor domain-domain-containing protein n=1 Tax=Naematelia encephala TaxID=71784 RepID=A0A1Y2AXQ3_9TREE|nr:fungal-specific transcription factor domain-domain-containing protein [Naematelia encephala]